MSITNRLGKIERALLPPPPPPALPRPRLVGYIGQHRFLPADLPENWDTVQLPDGLLCFRDREIYRAWHQVYGVASDIVIEYASEWR